MTKEKKELIIVEFANKEQAEYIEIKDFQCITEDNILKYQKPIYDGAGSLEKSINLNSPNVVSVSRIRLKSQNKNQ